MKKVIRLILSIACTLFLTVQLAAQLSDTTTIYQITTLDDNEFVGYILSETETTIEFKTATIGTITIQKNQIKKREQLISNESTNGLLWTENPMAFRYFLGNSGYTLKKGEAYYQNAWLFVNNFDIGLTDRFSMGIGIVPLFLFAGAPTPIWVTPKLSLPIESDKVTFGIGGLFGTAIGNDIDTPGYGYGFGNLTLGDKNKNLNIGIGYGFADGGIAERPTFSFSGMLRTGKRGYLLTENYILSTGFETIALLSLGGRFIGKRITLDYGGFYVPNTGEFVLVPWLSISIPIGKVR
ncbi:MAG: hypothetical protein AAGJ18_29705 [Bacteroidota bacterium]